MSASYRVILFDCINTILLPDPSQLPRLEVDGRSVISTAPLLHTHLAPLQPGLQALDVHHAARAAWRWSEERRGADCREIDARERFAHMLGLLKIEASPQVAAAALHLHMQAVVECMLLPPAHRELLQALSAQYRLALLSNFDHAPSLQQRLESLGVAQYFRPLMISAALGYRKPGAEAFARTLAALEAHPAEVLLVGDSVEDDVRGAQAAGLDVAWINPNGQEPPPPGPTYTLRSLPELHTLLAH